MKRKGIILHLYLHITATSLQRPRFPLSPRWPLRIGSIVYIFRLPNDFLFEVYTPGWRERDTARAKPSAQLLKFDLSLIHY